MIETAEAVKQGGRRPAVGYGPGGAGGNVFAGSYPPLPGGVPGLTLEQEKVLLEHLPVVRFLARRIHERLPSTSTSKTWSLPAWWG
ncbi:MAG TPA: hypothetical protein VGG85_00425 [Terracidiphilus sp.]|jgi:RNA polymerase sigma factor for flagellar operon FliA